MPLNLKVGTILKRLGKPYVFTHVSNTPIINIISTDTTGNSFNLMGFNVLVLSEESSTGEEVYSAYDDAYSAYNEVTPTETELTLVAAIYPPTPTTESSREVEVVGGNESVGVLCIILPSDTVIGIDDTVTTRGGEYKITGVIDYDSYFEFYSVKV